MLQITRTGSTLEIRLGGIPDEVFRTLPVEYQCQVEAVALERLLDGIPQRASVHAYPPPMQDIVQGRDRFIEQADTLGVDSAVIQEYVAFLRTNAERLLSAASALPQATRVVGRLDRWITLPQLVLRDLSLSKRSVSAFVRAHVPETMLPAVHVALEEAITNGLRHGNGGDIRRTLWIILRRCSSVLHCEVRDEGRGFTPEAVPDPTTLEASCMPSGRGLLFMRNFMDSVTHQDGGRTVVMEKNLRSQVFHLPCGDHC